VLPLLILEVHDSTGDVLRWCRASSPSSYCCDNSSPLRLLWHPQQAVPRRLGYQGAVGGMSRRLCWDADGKEDSPLQ